MKALILLRDIYSIISLTLIMKALILLSDIYSIISLTDNERFDLTVIKAFIISQADDTVNIPQ
jgi:hypothetical protein